MSNAAFAQGTVNWSAISPAAMTAQTNSTQSPPFVGSISYGGGTIGNAGGSAAGGTGFYFELLYAPYTGVQAPDPSSLAALLSWSDTGLEASNANTAGRLAPINPNAGAIVPWSPGTTDSIMMVGWSAPLGSSWSDVEYELANWNNTPIPQNAYLGVSATGYITTLATTTSPGSTVFGTGPTAQGLPIFSLNTQLYAMPLEIPPPPTPEPGTMALAGLGGLSLLLFRRRNV